MDQYWVCLKHFIDYCSVLWNDTTEQLVKLMKLCFFFSFILVNDMIMINKCRISVLGPVLVASIAEFTGSGS